MCQKNLAFYDFVRVNFVTPECPQRERVLLCTLIGVNCNQRYVHVIVKYSL